jgi:hypothetical protein
MAIGTICKVMYVVTAVSRSQSSGWCVPVIKHTSVSMHYVMGYVRSYCIFHSSLSLYKHMFLCLCLVCQFLHIFFFLLCSESQMYLKFNNRLPEGLSLAE